MSKPKAKKNISSSYLRIFVFNFFCFTATVAADTTQPAIDPQLLKTLQTIDAKTADIKDYSADFEQRKFSPLLKNPLISKGEIFARGIAMLWNTTSPEPTRMRIDATSMQIYYTGQKSLEQYPLKGKLAAMAASPLPRLATLMEQFEIRQQQNVVDLSGTYLILTPREAELKQYVDHVLVTLDRSGVVRHFELTDPDGERTAIDFTNPKINTGIDDHALDLNVAADAKTVHPLGQ